MEVYSNEPCRMDGCNRAAVVGSKYCIVHRSKAARVRDSMQRARKKTKGMKPSTYVVARMWKRIRNLFSSESRPKKTMGSRAGGHDYRSKLEPEEQTVELPWKWYTSPPVDDGQKLFQNLCRSLPGIFAAVGHSGLDLVFILADVRDLRWRGLLYLLFKYEAVYYSPESLFGQSPLYETLSGEPYYKAPVIAGKQLKVGIYAVERESLVSNLCCIRDIPTPLIKQVQADCPVGMFTVAYFCGRSLGVRHVSPDAKSDKSVPFSM